MRKTANNMTMKQNNRSRILNAILLNHVSRQDIADAIGLTPASVSILVGEMIEEGVLIETGDTITVSTRGRKRTTIDIHQDYRYIIGVAFEQDELVISLSTMKKVVLDRLTYRYYKPDIEFAFHYIEKTVHDLLAKHDLSITDILGFGVTIIGHVNSSTGVSYHAYELWDTMIPIKTRLENIFSVPVVVDNNVRALALAEKESRQSHENIVFIKYGPGIGASLVFDETIYRGATYNALEFGHTIVSQKGIPCSCGKTGCLETVASYKSIRRELEHIFTETTLYDEKDKHSMYNIDLSDIVYAYVQKDISVVSIINKAIHYFAIGIINLVQLFDSNLLILYGSFFEEDCFFEQLKETIRVLGCDCDSHIQRSILSNEKTIGAISIARKKLFLDTGAMIKEKHDDE